jgi:prepilin-type N-terminal cleavage/methylation domain-containing protein
MKKIAKNKGFTLIEILVVIGIIAVLATVVIVAINPARQFAQARNSQRQSNINTILNAIGQNLADNKGILTCGGSPKYFVGSTTIGTGTTDLTTCLASYIASGIPQDPNGGTSADTKYQISTTTSGTVMICAPFSNEAALGSPAPFCVLR